MTKENFNVGKRAWIVELITLGICLVILALSAVSGPLLAMTLWGMMVVPVVLLIYTLIIIATHGLGNSGLRWLLAFNIVMSGFFVVEIWLMATYVDPFYLQ